MELRVVKKVNICNQSLESIILEKIGDGDIDVFTEECDELKKILCNELIDDIKIDEIQIDNILVQKKV